MLWTEVRKGLRDARDEWRRWYWRVDRAIYDPLFDIWTEVLVGVAEALLAWSSAVDYFACACGEASWGLWMVGHWIGDRGATRRYGA